MDTNQYLKKQCMLGCRHSNRRTSFFLHCSNRSDPLNVRWGSFSSGFGLTIRCSDACSRINASSSLRRLVLRCQPPTVWWQPRWGTHFSFSSITVVAKEIRTSLWRNSPRTEKRFCLQASEGYEAHTRMCTHARTHSCRPTELNRACSPFSRACSVTIA